MRSLKYNGSMVYDSLTDAEIRANYQHKHVVDLYLKHFKDKKVLDAGCWTGTIEKEVSSRKFKCEIVGIDQNKAALKTAKSFPSIISR
jgi:ubiquinone/menaquinone biosynthesis C-methylase UbiE